MYPPLKFFKKIFKFRENKLKNPANQPQNDFAVDKNSTLFKDKQIESSKEMDEKAEFELDDLEKEENSPIPAVAAAVSPKDDSTLQSITFRFWVLSTFFSILSAFLSQIYAFRPNRTVYSPFFVLLGSYVIGKWMAAVLPTHQYQIGKWKFSLNPGPFNIKENVCIVISANASGSASGWASEVIAIQKLFFKKDVGWGIGILFIMSTLMIGYGIAGFLRKYLIYPANMIWPEVFPFTSLFSLLHSRTEKEANKRAQFFFITFSVILVWQFVPQYIFPWLTSMALLCFAGKSKTINILGSSYRGAGILSFSLDWNAISTLSPLITPWWATVIVILSGITAAWIIAPISYHYNVFEAKRLPFRSPNILDKTGAIYNQTYIIDQNNGSLNSTAYEEAGPVYISVTFALLYFYRFASLPAAITHVALFYGEEIYQRFHDKTCSKTEDIHYKKMKNYEEVPNWWYSLLFFSMLAVTVILGYMNDVNLPWWGTFLSISLSVITALPVGIITAVSGIKIGIHIVSQLICGYILPGRPIANAFFKAYSFLASYQCFCFLKQLKLGHYMKIPPRVLFLSQIWGTVLSGFTRFATLQLIFKTKRRILDGSESDPTGQWSGNVIQIGNAVTIIWGLIGPARVFGPSSIYHPLLYGFIFGAIIPIPIYLLHRRFPKANFKLFNTPLMLNALCILPTEYTNSLVMGLIAGGLSQFWAARYKKNWFKQYNYILSAALDSGTQIMTLLIFFCFSGLVKVDFPEWWGNNHQTQGERCFDDK